MTRRLVLALAVAGPLGGCAALPAVVAAFEGVGPAALAVQTAAGVVSDAWCSPLATGWRAALVAALGRERSVCERP